MRCQDGERAGVQLRTVPGGLRAQQLRGHHYTERRPEWDAHGRPGQSAYFEEKEPDGGVEFPATDCTFDVTFTQTKKPFKNRIFNNGHRGSGHITGKPAKYKYSVIVNGTQIKDPMIIVH